MVAPAISVVGQLQKQRSCHRPPSGTGCRASSGICRVCRALARAGLRAGINLCRARDIAIPKRRCELLRLSGRRQAPGARAAACGRAHFGSDQGDEMLPGGVHVGLAHKHGMRLGVRLGWRIESMWKAMPLVTVLFGGAALGLAQVARWLEPSALPAAAAAGLFAIGLVLIFASPTRSAEASEPRVTPELLKRSLLAASTASAKLKAIDVSHLPHDIDSQKA